MVNLEFKKIKHLWIFAQFSILIKINPWLDFGREIWPNLHIQILATTFILFVLKVNEEGQVGPSSWSDLNKGNIINSYFIPLIYFYHFVSILIHHSFLEYYFVWHLYMFIYLLIFMTFTIKNFSVYIYIYIFGVISLNSKANASIHYNFKLINFKIQNIDVIKKNYIQFVVLFV